MLPTTPFWDKALGIVPVLAIGGMAYQYPWTLVLIALFVLLR